jgi:intracellular sulfur oxidation DsrE/DsrF family protein
MTRLRARRWLVAPLLTLAFTLPFIATLVLTAAESAGPKEEKPKPHRIVFQVNSEDPMAMRHAITNSLNASKHYKDRNEPLLIEIVAYGQGIHMFRVDTSPVRDLLQFLRANNPDIAFSACGNTKTIMERNEGRAVSLLDGIQVVPFGVVRLVELQEAGWSYMRP